ncbi:DUF1648 domain-containing protein [Microbacterium paraoxydans]|uniref:DUF1648 domain-containing protein n=1 Tax=Microbacterium paraoxydans TaxID=199592 RepID=UPI003D73733C
MTTHDLTRTPPALLRRARLVFVVVAVVVPGLITAATTAVLLAWLPSFPASVAVHWGLNGADRFDTPLVYLWVLLGVGLGVPLLMAVTTLAAVGAHWGGTARLMGAFAAGMSAFAAAISLGSLGIQRDLAPTGEVPGIGGVMALAFGMLIVIGVLAWLVQPRVRPEPGHTLEPRHAVRVADGERVVWVGTTTMPRGALAFLLVVLAGLIALAVWMLVGGVSGSWIALLVTVVVAVAIAATTSFRVRVTPEGFTAQAPLGWPRLRLPIDRIVSARAVTVSPFGEFGGWGWRFSPDGRSGIVMRQGPAIEVARRDRGPFIVTIDGAEEAAALLQAYVDRPPARPVRGDAADGTIEGSGR